MVKDRQRHVRHGAVDVTIRHPQVFALEFDMSVLTGDPSAEVAVAEVLLIDDSPEFINYVTRLLTLESPDLVATPWDFRNGLPPVDYDWRHTKLVLLDYRLGDENGLAWLETLRERPQVPPIVMVTSSRDERIRDAALALGAHAFFLKEALTRASLSALLRDRSP